MDIINQGNIVSAKVSELKHHPKNPRKGNVDLIAESIRVNGFYGALIVQKSTNYVLAGNHRLLGAKHLGMEEVPVIYVDVDEVQATKILLADNRVSDTAIYDEDLLLELLEDLNDMGENFGIGYDINTDSLIKDIETNLVEAPKSKDLDELKVNYDKGMNARQVVLMYSAQDYDTIVLMLEELRKKFKMNSYSDVVKKLLEENEAE